MGILEQPQIFRLGRIGGTNLGGLDGKIGLTETAAREQVLICS